MSRRWPTKTMFKSRKKDLRSKLSYKWEKFLLIYDERKRDSFRFNEKISQWTKRGFTY